MSDEVRIVLVLDPRPLTSHVSTVNPRSKIEVEKCWQYEEEEVVEGFKVFLSVLKKYHRRDHDNIRWPSHLSSKFDERITEYYQRDVNHTRIHGDQTVDWLNTISFSPARTSKQPGQPKLHKLVKGKSVYLWTSILTFSGDVVNVTKIYR